MCQSKEEGGRRCGCDTSAKRRLRRKASIIIEQASSTADSATLLEPELDVDAFLDSFTNSVEPEARPKWVVATKIGTSTDIDNLRRVSSELNDKIHAPVPECMESSEYYPYLEEEITTFGALLAQEADRRVGMSRKDIEKVLDDKQEELYSTVSKELNDAQMELADVRFNIRELVKEREDLDSLSPQDRRNLDSLSPEKIMELPEDIQEKIAELIDSIDKVSYCKNQFDSVDAEYEAFRDELYARQVSLREQAHKELISEIRPVGGKIRIRDDSDAESVELLQDTVGKHYPSAWLKKSAEHESELQVVSTDIRPSFASAVLIEEEDGIEKYSQIEQNFSFIPGTDDNTGIDDPRIISLREEATGNATIQSWMGQKGVFLTSSFPSAETYSLEEHGELIDEKPQGEGWELRSKAWTPEIEKVSTDNASDFLDAAAEKVWVRPKLTTRKEISVMKLFSKEVTDKISGASERLTEGTAYHEFGHRIEQVIPQLPLLEKAFLARRSDKTESYFHEDLRILSSSGTNVEVGHRPDSSFATDYTGRDYLTGTAYEVFTTGIEAVYSDSYGGLGGLSKKTMFSDDNHRAFTLGILASL